VVLRSAQAAQPEQAHPEAQSPATRCKDTKNNNYIAYIALQYKNNV